ncbi:MAG: D-alanine--D-alanine ligase [Nitrospiraceae bacterium]|nr:D-alanine--D-alanine ligase [Nitrospiraceae bacterium]
MMDRKEKIGVLCGGLSAERDVSLRSGKAVYNALKERGYNVVLIDAGHDLCEALRKEAVQRVFIALHGGAGENGSVQGMLEVMGIPYTGSGVLASAAAMDKDMSKKIFMHHNISVPPFAVVSRSDHASVKDMVSGFSSIAPFGLPCVVKPAEEGSSIGVSIVKNVSELQGALEEGFRHGSTLIIEKYIKGKEIQIGISAGKALGGVEVRPSAEFYSYEAKYTAGATQYILPPEVDEESYSRLRAAALAAHNALGCKGATRVDLMLDEDGREYVLEVNTIPGMTETSLLPKIAALSGMNFGDLVEEIISLA